MLSIFRRWRRRRILASPISEEWSGVLRSNLQYYSLLSNSQRDKIDRSVQVIVAEKYWEGIEGFTVTDEVKVTIAGTASLLLLGQTTPYYFDSVRTIIVYPDTIRRDRSMGGGLVEDQPQHLSGEAWQGGPLIFSWPDVYRESRRPSHGNVVIHEFAHHIDGLDGEMGGIPSIQDDRMFQRWKTVFAREYEELVISSNLGQPTAIDTYAATSQAEFFAVATETFVVAPERLKQSMPEVFELLVSFFSFDPSTWIRSND